MWSSRFTARISEFMDVLDDLGDGRYMRTMVASSTDVSDSEY